MNSIKLLKTGCKRDSTLDNYALKLCAYIIYILTLSSFWVINAKDIQTGDDLPYFADTLNNVTVSVGRDATFQCIVHNLKNEYQVAWFHKDKHTLLALQGVVIFKSGRLSVSSHAGTTFYLHIRDIREEDRGQYMCQINTVPMKNQIGFLDVVVPPRFIEKYTSSDQDVREDSSLSLRCSATGSPEPEIKWRREDGQPIDMHSNSSSKSNQKVISTNGEYLNITKVTRLHMGAYICIASNGIPPAVSKRIFLGVKFSPLIWPPNQMIGSTIGSHVILECNLESHPQSLTSWIKNTNQAIIHPNSKYTVYTEPTNSPYRIGMRLKINDLNAEDFGTYKCLAKNILGEVEASIKLFETSKPMTKTVKEPKLRKTFHQKNDFEDNGEEDTRNKAVVLTEVLGYEITSEHITLQTEDRVTHNSRNHNSERSDACNINPPNIEFITLLSVLYIWIQNRRFCSYYL